jgi:hypothetical protein
MDAKNLAIVFSPVVFGEEEISQGDLLSVQQTKVRHISYLFSFTYLFVQDSTMEDLIENAHVLFDEPLPPSSPPLPPAPDGEPIPDICYGSSHTKVTLSQSRQAQVADFAPQLPPRPMSSIHPSARSNPPMLSPQLPVDLSGCPIPTPTTLPPAVPLRVKISADEMDQPTQVQAVSNASAAGVAERTQSQFQVSIPPSPASTREQQNQQQLQEVTESVPETPLTASSRTSDSSQSRGLL